MLKEPYHFLISRDNHIGDVILIMPFIYKLKELYPNSKITLLIHSYTKAIVDCYSAVDASICFDKLAHLSDANIAKLFREHQFTHFFNTIPRKRHAKIAFLAKIPKRIGTSHKLYHWLFLNKRINYRKGEYGIHESQIHYHLLKGLGLKTLNPKSISLTMPALVPKKALIKKYPLSNEKFNLVIHPGSNLSGNEWPIEHFIELARQLDRKIYTVYVTGRENEKQRFLQLLREPNVIDLTCQFSLEQLSLLLAEADGLLSSGTGPLHMMAAIGNHALGLYPTPGYALRWHPLGPKSQHLIGGNDNDSHNNSCPNGTACACMKKITPLIVSSKIQEWQQVKVNEDIS